MEAHESIDQLTRRNGLFESWLEDVETQKTGFRDDLDAAIAKVRKEHF